MRPRLTVFTVAATTAIALIAVKVLMTGTPAPVQADDPPDELRIFGVIRDFTPDHPDFNITDPAVMGHQAMNVGATLPADRRPVYFGTGLKVTQQWIDKDDNPIKPYIPATDPGLPGGHFDVDVFDELTDKELYHKHEFDDAFDVTYVDLVQDEKLLLDAVIAPDYPNDLRIEFLNPHHASGIFTFQAGGPVLTQSAREPFEATFSRAALTQCRVDFAWLLEMRGTSPGDVQGDVVDRDDAFSIRMYDVTTDELVYELAVYHHGEEGSLELPTSAGGQDSCGGSIDDAIGDFGDHAGGAVSSASSYDHWYRDVLGTNLSMPHPITLTRNGLGVYEHFTGAFYPIDGRLLGDGSASHNLFFTYAIAARFTHDACAGWFFEFEGNDDCWVFIDDRLVIDLGGVATPTRQYVALDRLGLVDGQEYKFDFFYAHRRATLDSVFRIRTNIPLSTAGSVPVSMQYD